MVEPRRPRSLHLLLGLADLAAIVCIVGWYVSFWLQLPEVLDLAGELFGTRRTAELDQANRVAYAEVAHRFLVVFSVLSVLWMFAAILVFAGRNWARIVMIAMGGVWLVSVSLILVSSFAEHGRMAGTLVFLPGLKSYIASGGVLTFVAVESVVTLSLIVTVLVCLFVRPTSDYLRAMKRFRVERKRIRRQRQHPATSAAATETAPFVHPFGAT